MEELNTHLKQQAEANSFGESDGAEEADHPYFGNEDEDDGPTSDILDSQREFGFEVERDEGNS